MAVSFRLKSLSGVWQKRSHPFWVAMQFGATRFSAAAKYILAARMAGPQAMGEVGVAILGMTAVEVMTDMGLGQAIVQQTDEVTEEQQRASWTLGMLRGLFASALIALLAPLLARLFGSPGATNLLYLCALLPLIRTATTPRFTIALRERDFRIHALLASVPALLDMIVSLVILALTGNAIGIVIGLIVGELVKTLAGYVVFRDWPQFNFNLRSIRSLNAYGSWIWFSGIITFLLAQFDKFLVGAYLGPQALGLYQVAGRIAQLSLADVAAAASNYLFPTFAERYRQNPERAKNFFDQVFLVSVLLTAIVTALSWIFASPIVSVSLGKQWIEAAPVFQLLSVGMGLGALNTILTAYTRAIGAPKWSSYTTTISSILYIPIGLVLVRSSGANGLALSTAIGAGAGVVALLQIAVVRRVVDLRTAIAVALIASVTAVAVLLLEH
ncbi:oligosaccharide flippase family protein [Deinococcus sp. PESE-13]